MKYKCKICEYSTDRRNNYDKHLNTDKHKFNLKNQNISKMAPQSPRKNILGYVCKYCDKHFKYSRGYSRHISSCRDKNELWYKYSEISSKFSDISSKYDELQGHNMELVEKYEELVDKYDVKCDQLESGLIKTITHKSTNPNVYSFVHGNFTKTKPLVPIKEGDVPTLKFIYDILKKKNGKMALCDELQHHNMHKTLKVFFGDFYIDSYKKDDKETQQFFSTDCARLNYIVRGIVNGVPKWKRDNKGLIISEYLINPVLKYIRKHLETYTQKYLDESFHNAKNGVDKVYAVEKMHRLLAVTKQIDDGTLNSSILRYISAHFKLDQTFIDQYDKNDDKYIKHKTKVKTKVKNKVKTKIKNKVKTKKSR